MSSYFARYAAGEHDDVWKDLRALGRAALEGPVREDAEAVAAEMGSRALFNVETLVARLGAAGYVFRENDDDLTPRAAHIPPSAQADAWVEWLESSFGPLPLTVRAWIQSVGDVWLVGDHPLWPSSELGDPLVVEFEGSGHGGMRDYYASEYESWLEAEDDPDRAPFELSYAPDALHKANISGDAPYGIELPAVGVDGRVGPATWFVDDLNAAFAAGGFPGTLYSEGYQDPPAGLLDDLARDLLRL
ncbi:hypothetical protein [Myceligenerans crystallogenes]|uniref:Knr4/Smi1-like domain-containing protein n=1 Tax=Myceligenerans crystallogenes TaxID=316335 RepID=A0ABN2NIS8_9MICO